MLMTTGQAARRLGISRYTVYEWVSTGKVPSRRWGIKYLIDEAAFELMAQLVKGRAIT
jgi:excisionase family DNA binding protein